MAYSSTAVRFFTAPKPLGNTMDGSQSKQILDTRVSLTYEENCGSR